MFWQLPALATQRASGARILGKFWYRFWQLPALATQRASGARILGRLRRKFRQVLGQVLAQDGAGCIPSHGVGLRAMEQFAPQGPSMGSDSERPPYNTKLTPRYHLTPVLI